MEIVYVLILIHFLMISVSVRLAQQSIIMYVILVMYSIVHFVNKIMYVLLV